MTSKRFTNLYVRWFDVENKVKVDDDFWEKPFFNPEDFDNLDQEGGINLGGGGSHTPTTPSSFLLNKKVDKLKTRLHETEFLKKVLTVSVLMSPFYQALNTPLSILQTEDILFDVKKGFHFYPNFGAKIHNGCQYFYGNKKNYV